MNPFDLPGPEFLKLFAVVALVASVLSIVLVILMRWWLGRDAYTSPLEDNPDLGPYEVAYLSGGETLAINAATSDLIRRGLLVVDAEGGVIRKGQREPRLRRSDKRTKPADKLEKSIHGSLSSDVGDSASFLGIRPKVSKACDQIRERLEGYGLLITSDRIDKLLWPSVAMALLVTLFGAIKVLVGLSRDRDVGILVFLCIGFFVLMVGWNRFLTHCLVNPPFRSQAGNRVLKEIKAENEALRHIVVRKPELLGSGDLALAAVEGVSDVVLADFTHLGVLQQAATIADDPVFRGVLARLQR